MFIFGNLFLALAQILHVVLNLYMYIVIARALISWVNPDPYNPIVRFLYNATEPLFQALRRRIPLLFGGFDFTPMVILLIIIFLDNFLVASLTRLAIRMNY